ncbi:hypothetical protein DFH09DRAFT_1321933 [Mycena vulgaris]|nr:hypothetical protein DFH09DRAFT_1321933 [Mycena vulgaris]
MYRLDSSLTSSKHKAQPPPALYPPRPVPSLPRSDEFGRAPSSIERAFVFHALALDFAVYMSPLSLVRPTRAQLAHWPTFTIIASRDNVRRRFLAPPNTFLLHAHL